MAGAAGWRGAAGAKGELCIFAAGQSRTLSGDVWHCPVWRSYEPDTPGQRPIRALSGVRPRVRCPSGKLCFCVGFFFLVDEPHESARCRLIGFLHSASADTFAERLRGFRQGLKETGYVEGENVAVEYHSAENQIDRLPELAAKLVRRHQLPGSKAPDRPDFHRGFRFAPRFAQKGREIAPGLRRMGTRRRSSCLGRRSWLRRTVAIHDQWS